MATGGRWWVLSVMMTGEGQGDSPSSWQLTCKCSRDRRQGQQLARSIRGEARAWLMAVDNEDAGECCGGVGSFVITVQASQQAVVVVGAAAHGAGRSAAASSSMELE
ncbi:hypothetical protein NL676_017643 [Syzygium grande]|nr:hypothetical protein NL676_017643 [Syzygium grande]